MLKLIDKGVPIEVVRDASITRGAGIGVEAMCFTGFPTETREALATVRFLETPRRPRRLHLGEFDLTQGSLVAQTPERFGIRETWQVEGDELGTGLFFEEQTPPKRDGEPSVDEALYKLSGSWLLRSYPWAGALSTAHTLL